MRPVLFTVLGFPVQSYGLSKALAAVAAAWLLALAFRRRGLNPDHAYTLTVAGTLWGFAGAKVYYLAEHGWQQAWHHLGSGFTWYGGLIAGTLAVVVQARRLHVPLLPLAGMVVAPLSLAYGIGRLGCLLAGDGTYGKPSGLPWAMSFPDGMVPTTERVHPTPLYEALAAVALAAVLWQLQGRWHPLRVLALYLVGSGLARLLVEALRINQPALLGLTQPQLWSLVLIAGGVVLWILAGRAGPARLPDAPAPDLLATPAG